MATDQAWKEHGSITLAHELHLLDSMWKAEGAQTSACSIHCNAAELHVLMHAWQALLKWLVDMD
jgi:hypothetical protein